MGVVCQLYLLLCRKQMEVAVSLEGFGWVNFCAAWAGREGQCLWKESPSESGVSVSGLRTEFSFLFFFFCFVLFLFCFCYLFFSFIFFFTFLEFPFLY